MIYSDESKLQSKCPSYNALNGLNVEMNFLGSHTNNKSELHIRLPTHQICFIFRKSCQNLVKWYGITHTVNPNRYKGGLYDAGGH